MTDPTPQVPVPGSYLECSGCGATLSFPADATPSEISQITIGFNKDHDHIQYKETSVE